MYKRIQKTFVENPKNMKTQQIFVVTSLDELLLKDGM